MDKRMNLTMLTDFYEITMANGYFESGMADDIAYFDMFFRRVPDGGGECAAAEGTEALADSELNRFASFVRDSLLSEDTAPHESIYEDMIQLYKDEIRKKDVWISRLFWCLAGIMMFILFVLVFDILNPTFGFVMY